jgi:hypothetical protein
MTRRFQNLVELIPELRDWNGGKGISAHAWIACTTRIEHAIALAALFWPDFVGHEGCVFFADFSVERYQEFLHSLAGDKKAAQAAVNHRHNADLFGSEEMTSEQLRFLGHLLMDMWQSKLDRDFRDVRVKVSLTEGTDGDALGYEITFYAS